jgi:DNA-binding NtrC family response regulator
MTTPEIALPLPPPEGSPAKLSPPDASPAKKKRVLLLDTSQTRRDLRADVMRRLGIDVDCAADVLEARCWWRADLYNLVLINVAGEIESRDKFCTDLRSANPPQKIAFFVGGPEYLAAMPHSDQQPAEMDASSLNKEMVAALLAHASEKSSHQRWGILEACKRISSVRSVSEARSRAIRETPRPSRWSDAIEQYSAPEAPAPQTPLFAKAVFTEAALLNAVPPKEREEAL